jgi:hypothetical protein
MAFICAYEASLGGHEEYIQPKQECLVYLIAHRLDLAKANMPFVRSILDDSPMLQKEIAAHTAERIELKNGLAIVPSPPSLKAQRGVAIPVVAMDEVGFWYSDPDAANPDFEVERAVSYSQAQFPNAKRIGISTPWTKEGLLYKYHKAGTEGNKLSPEVDKEEYKDILVCFSTTAAFENPFITRKKLERLRLRDAEAFERESLCKFLDSVSGFLSGQLVDIAAIKGGGHAERSPVDAKDRIQPNYVASMDPAFRQDDFGFQICHKEASGIVVDVIRRWTPIRGQKLNPKEILTEITDLCKPYGIQLIYSDQYQLESLQQIALDMGMSIEGVDFTAKSKSKIYGNLQQLFNQQKVTLLDPDLNPDARVQQQQLVQLERRLTTNGGVLIGAPEGKHDDMCSILALGAFKAMWMDPDIKPDEVPREPTLFERGMATIRKRQQLAAMGGDY